MRKVGSQRASRPLMWKISSKRTWLSYAVWIAKQAERLHLSSRRVIWLNPLLRWDGFEAKAQGIKALLPHVDTFVSAHNVQSLENLAEILSRVELSGEKQRLLTAAA